MFQIMVVASLLAGSTASLAEAEAKRAEIRSRYAPELDKAHRSLSAASTAMKQAVVEVEVQVAAARSQLQTAKKPRVARPDELGVGRTLGIKMSNVTSSTAEDLDMPAARGAKVVEIQDGGDGKLAGLKPNDVILGFDGQEVQGPRDLVSLAAIAPLHRKVYIEVWRKKSTKILTIPAVTEIVDASKVATAQEALDRAEAAAAAVRSTFGEKVMLAERSVGDLTDAMQRELEAVQREVDRQKEQDAAISAALAKASAAKVRPTLGVKLRDARAQEGEGTGAMILAVKADGLAHLANVRAGDVVTVFDGKDVRTAAQLVAVAKQTDRGDKRIFLEVWRAGARLLLAVPSLSDSAAPAPVVLTEPAAKPAMAATQPRPVETHEEPAVETAPAGRRPVVVGGSHAPVTRIDLEAELEID